MSHRGGLPGPRPAVVSGGAFSALLTVVGPVALVLALLAVPAGAARNVLLLVGWLVIAVAVELRDRRRRRPTGRASPAVSAIRAAPPPGPAVGHRTTRPLQGVLDP